MATINHSSLSDYLQDSVLDYLFRSGSLTSSSTLYLSLFVDSPGADASGSELSGSGYERVCVYTTGSEGSPFIVSGSYAYNRYMMEFPTTTASWGNIEYYGIHSASQSGSLLFYGAFSASRVVNEGDTPRIIPNAVRLTMGAETGSPLSGSLLNHILNNVVYTSPSATMYAGLAKITTLPGITGTQYTYTELSGSGYARMFIGGDAFWQAATSGCILNSASVVFSYSTTASWGTIDAVILYDASTSGNILFWSDTSGDREVREHDGYYIPVNGLKIHIIGVSATARVAPTFN